MVWPRKGIAAWLSGRRGDKGCRYGRLGDVEGEDYCVQVPSHGEDDNRIADYSTDIHVKQDDVCPHVFRLLIEEKERVVAICGERGIGKSSLLEKLQLEALSSGMFTHVIRVTSPDTGNMEEKIIHQIAIGMGLSVVKPYKLGERIIDRQRVRPQSFMLLIDDLMKPPRILHDLMNLPAFGRAVFTTRLRNLPHRMNCPSLQVAPLDPEQSWALLQRELAGDDHAAASTMVSHPAAMKLAKEMVEECRGLPLAVKVLAGAMKGIGRRSLEELREEATDLGSPIKLFRFAMDCLPSDAVRECFLYVALFPKGHWVSQQELIQHWIGDGLLPSVGGCNSSSIDTDHVTHAVKRGQDVIEMLKSANLLVGLCESRGVSRAVQVHNTLRQMALCANRELLVQSGVALNEAPAAKEWELAKRISLMSNEIEEMEETPRCYWLETLFIHYNRSLCALPKSFFQFMPRVKVLDLSYSHVEDLPTSIGQMVELQYLNSSYTPIESLPEEMRNLKKLKCLKLRYTWHLRDGIYFPHIQTTKKQ